MSPDKRDDPFLAGSLWNSVVDRSKQALAQRALQPIPTTLEVIRDGHAEFHLRVLSHLKEKPVERQQQPAGFNPFLPYDPALFVADISDTHVALLNKYNVVEHHLLVVTREFESQTSRLTQADFAAVARCLFEYPALAFYNSGVEAGASQSHKHLQLLPLHHRGDMMPLEPLFQVEQFTVDLPDQSPVLDFEHRLVHLAATDKIEALESQLMKAYESTLASLNWKQIDDTVPYNLLVTREWMLMVPRRSESFHAISLNAMAFAGSFFVKNQADRDLLIAEGPLNALRSVSQPSAS